jgi:hypothetical protein
MDWAGVGVLVTAITCLIIAWQAREMRRATAVMERNTEETRKSAEASRKSTELQEAASRQWIDIKNWAVFPEKPKGETGRLYVNFAVINPTTQPLTLLLAETSMDGNVWRMDKRLCLTPGSSHLIHFPFVFTEKTENASFLPIGVKVWFIDNNHRLEEAPFRGTLIRRTNGSYYFEAETTIFFRDSAQRDDGQETATEEKPDARLPQKAI